MINSISEDDMKQPESSEDDATPEEPQNEAEASKEQATLDKSNPDY